MPGKRHPKRAHSYTPWDEHQWGKHIDEQERKSEKYLKILDEFGSPPGSKGVLDKSWQSGESNTPDSSGEKSPDFIKGGWEWPDWPHSDPNDSEETLALAEANETRKARLEQLESCPSYRKAQAFCQEIRGILNGHGTGSDLPRAMIELTTHALAIPAKISGSLAVHRNGDNLGLAIAYCKRAMGETQKCLAALCEIGGSQLLTNKDVNRLTGMALDVREEIVTQIAEYRRRWQRRYGVS